MAQLISYPSQLALTDKKLAEVLDQVREYLRDRVKACYLFGSCAKGTFRVDSDIDLLIIAESSLPFIERLFTYEHLLDIFPRIDFFVYTEEEFSRHINNPTHGFWHIINAQKQQIL